MSKIISRPDNNRSNNQYGLKFQPSDLMIEDFIREVTDIQTLSLNFPRPYGKNSNHPSASIRGITNTGRWDSFR